MTHCHVLSLWLPCTFHRLLLLFRWTVQCLYALPNEHGKMHVHGTNIYMYTTTLRYNVHTARCSDVPPHYLNWCSDIPQHWGAFSGWRSGRYCFYFHPVLRAAQILSKHIIFCLRILIWCRLRSLAKVLVRFLGLWVNIYLWILFSFNLKIMGGQAFTLSEGQSGQ